MRLLRRVLVGTQSACGITIPPITLCWPERNDRMVSSRTSVLHRNVRPITSFDVAEEKRTVLLGFQHLVLPFESFSWITWTTLKRTTKSSCSRLSSICRRPFNVFLVNRLFWRVDLAFGQPICLLDIPDNRSTLQLLLRPSLSTIEPSILVGYYLYTTSILLSPSCWVTRLLLRHTMKQSIGPLPCF